MIGQAEFHAAIGDQSREPAEPRFRIHRNNVMGALISALRVRFPITARQLGPAGFAAVAGDYADGQRPASPVLIDYGDSFPEHLAGHHAIPDRLQLADLARLENLWWLAYHAADVPPAPLSILSDVAEEAWGRARFSFLPSLGLMASAYPVGSIWQGDTSPAGRQNLLVVRPEAEVSIHLIDDARFVLLSGLAGGFTLAEAVETATRQHGPFDLVAALQGLIAHRIISGVSA